MKREPTAKTGVCRGSSGFSMIELLVVIAIILIVVGVSIPTVMTSYRNYQLNSAASQLVSIVKLTRFDAIRQNTLLACKWNQNASNQWQIWDSSSGGASPSSTEPQFLLPNVPTLMGSGSAPNSANLLSALGVSSLNVLSATAGNVSFDWRGAVSGATGYSVFYIGNPNPSQYGARAVILLPSGATQLWESSGAGNWVEMN